MSRKSYQFSFPNVSMEQRDTVFFADNVYIFTSSKVIVTNELYIVFPIKNKYFVKDVF